MIMMVLMMIVSMIAVMIVVVMVTHGISITATLSSLLLQYHTHTDAIQIFPEFSSPHHHRDTSTTTRAVVGSNIQ